MGDVVDLAAARRARLVGDRPPPKLQEDRSKGLLTTRPGVYTDQANKQFGDRLTRIRASIDRINKLMAGLVDSTRYDEAPEEMK